MARLAIGHPLGPSITLSPSSLWAPPNVGKVEQGRLMVATTTRMIAGPYAPFGE